MDHASIRRDLEATAAAAAQARGLTLDAVMAHHKDEAWRVCHEAYARAARRGTLPEQEVAGVARRRPSEEQARRRRKEEDLARHGPEFIAVEKKLRTASRHLRAALRVGGGLAFPDLYRDVLAYSIDTMRRAVATVEETIRRKEDRS